MPVGGLEAAIAGGGCEAGERGPCATPGVGWAVIAVVVLVARAGVKDSGVGAGAGGALSMGAGAGDGPATPALVPDAAGPSTRALRMPMSEPPPTTATAPIARATARFRKDKAH